MKTFWSDPIRRREGFIALGLIMIYTSLTAAWTLFTLHWNLPLVWQKALAIQPPGIGSGLIGMIVAQRWLTNVLRTPPNHPGLRKGRQLLVGFFYFTPVETLILYGPAVNWIHGWNAISTEWLRSLVILLIYAPLAMDGINLFGARWWIDGLKRKEATKSLKGSLSIFTWQSVLLLLPFCAAALSTQNVILRASELQIGFLLWTVNLYLHSGSTFTPSKPLRGLRWLFALQNHPMYPAFIQSAMAGLLAIFLTQLFSPFVPFLWISLLFSTSWFITTLLAVKESVELMGALHVAVIPHIKDIPIKSDVTLKPATMVDLSELQQFRQTEFVSHVRSDAVLAPPVLLDLIVRNEWPGIIFLAREDSGRLLGYVVCYENPARHYAEIEELSTASYARGQGVGKKLLRMAVDHYQIENRIERLYIEDGSTTRATSSLASRMGFYQHRYVSDLLFLNITEKSLRDDTDNSTRGRQRAAPGFLAGDPRALPHGLLMKYYEAGKQFQQEHSYEEARYIFELLITFSKNNLAALTALQILNREKDYQANHFGLRTQAAAA